MKLVNSCLVVTILALATCFSINVAAKGVYPVFSGMNITSCDDDYCYILKYTWSPVITWVPLPENPAPRGNSRYIMPFGVHCKTWSAEKGYSSCVWTALLHAPIVDTPCHETAAGSWEVIDRASCRIIQTQGYHSGKSPPGAECAMMGDAVKDASKTLPTPWGVLDADNIANHGFAFCLKADPPNMPCKINASNIVIDHGVVQAGKTDTRSITVPIACGLKPVAVMAAPEVNIADGVKAITSAEASAGQVVITSKLTVGAGVKGGEYSASSVLVVSAQ